MQFLIYNKTHWFFECDEHQQKAFNFDGRFDGIRERGDFIEIRPDGYFLNGNNVVRGWKKSIFVVIDVPDLTKKKAIENIYGGKTTENPIYKIDIDSIPIALQNKIITDGWARVYWPQIEPYLTKKS